METIAREESFWELLGTLKAISQVSLSELLHHIRVQTNDAAAGSLSIMMGEGATCESEGQCRGGDTDNYSQPGIYYGTQHKLPQVRWE